MKRKVLILGAAGRDFHNFNMFFRDNPEYMVVGFTATQIPNIANRRYPGTLAGKLYSKGIPIYDEKDLESLIEKNMIDEVYFSYSDVSHKYVMNMASRAQAKGASFVLLGPKETMLKSTKKVIAVTAVRTGSGKTTFTRKLTMLLKKKKVKFVVIRHPMPYGELYKQRVQRFAKFEDLAKNECTIEEREEYEPHLRDGVIVYAGVDYEMILREAEKEADVIIWDGGNNDMSFIRPDLQFTLADSLRPGHEVWYYPGESNFRSANVIVVTKIGENPTDVKRIVRNATKLNPKAEIIETDMELSTDKPTNIEGKSVIVIEDGPTVTHGEMKFGAGHEFASQHKANILDPRSFAVGSIKQAYVKFDHMGNVVPALGYYGKQLKELEETINNSKADYVVSGTPMDLGRLLKIKIPILHVNYDTVETKGNVEKVIDRFLKK